MSDPSANLRRRRRLSLRRKVKKQKAHVMSMMEHLEELRDRLIRSVGIFAVISIVAFIFFNAISDFLLSPLCALPAERLGPNGCDLIVTGALEPVSVRLKVSALTAVVVGAPFFLYQIYAFVVPGLSTKEKKYALPFILLSSMFFLLGTTFAYLTLPKGLDFLLALGGENFVPFFKAADYLNFVGLVFIAFGVTFELPLLVFFLGLAGVVSVEQLKGFRKGAIVSITLLSAVVTPSQDPFTMLAMAVPLYLFYEGTILALRLIGRRKKAASGASVS